MSRNFLGGFYQPGKLLPVFVREDIIDLYNNGVGVSEISRKARVICRFPLITFFKSKLLTFC